MYSWRYPLAYLISAVLWLCLQ